MAKDVIKAIPLSVFNAAALNGNWQEIDPNGFPEAITVFRINNASNVGFSMSYDGAHAHEYVLPNHEFTLNLNGNGQPGARKAFFNKGTKVYVSGAAGVGFIWLSGYYQE